MQSQSAYRDHDFSELLELAHAQSLQDPNTAKRLDHSLAV